MDYTALKKLGESSCCSIDFLTYLLLKGKKSLLDWCMSVGLISSTYECPNCGRIMNLCSIKETDIGYEWRCSKLHGSNKHETSRNVVGGSCFSYFHLTVYKTLRCMQYWLFKNQLTYVKYELEIDEQMVADCYTLCREICVTDLITNSDKIGGKEVKIEMDVCKLGEMKYSQDKLPSGHWVFGGFDGRTKKCFIRVAEKNTKQEFLNVVSEWILPGSIIVSGCLEFYDCHSDEDFISLCSAHSLVFKDSCMNVRNKIIEAARSAFEGPIRNNIGVVFDSYLGEHIWRKKHENTNFDNKFQIFLKAISENYRPYCRDAAGSFKL